MHPYQATNSYDSDILGSGSSTVLLERAEDGDTATEHGRSHSRWDLFRDLQQDTVRQNTLNETRNLTACLNDEMRWDTSVVGVLERSEYVA